MQAFILKLLVSAVQNEAIRAFLFEAVEKLGAFLLPRLAALIPTAAAATAKVLLDKIPNLPGIGDLGQVTQEVHDAVNAVLPDDIDIPILSDVVKDFTGFDLTDWLQGKH